LDTFHKVMTFAKIIPKCCKHIKKQLVLNYSSINW